MSPALAGGFFTTSATWEHPHNLKTYNEKKSLKNCRLDKWIFSKDIYWIYTIDQKCCLQKKREGRIKQLLLWKDSLFFFFFFFLHFKFKNVKTYFHLEGHIRAGSEPDPAHRLWFANPWPDYHDCGPWTRAGLTQLTVPKTEITGEEAGEEEASCPAFWDPLPPHPTHSLPIREGTSSRTGVTRGGPGSSIHQSLLLYRTNIPFHRATCQRMSDTPTRNPRTGRVPGPGRIL